ncbi:hypothetical protein C7T94_12785 [Pedobacter yulinensis]|uniref:Uncharacterized protein n=1 Tax=Pedobacter yulinensis TaxID=2126353 RepID=A0A2T3HLW9_9SPHI|nr:hypothetical protein [Pedobacter yulinensis]PST83435.1 hypothetical protein C7T94_12785 [Pedobacter yulinensis]
MIHGCKLTLSLGEQSVHIENDAALQALLAQDTEGRTFELAQLLKQLYLNHKGEQLRIPLRSLEVEIWGHMYWDLQTRRLCKVFSAGIFRKLFAFLLRPTAWIDCGARGQDSNRRLWDFLAERPFLAKLLNPGRLINKQQNNIHK